MRISATTRAALALALLLPGLATAAGPHCDDPGADAAIPTVALETVATGLHHPVNLAHAGDGSGRLYIVEQAGRIRLLEGGSVRPEPFLDIDRRVDSGGEKGLLGLAFHPHYARNGEFFVNYTRDDEDGLHTYISRFRRHDAWRANPDSEVVLLRIRQPWGNHNGGHIAFGPDDFLYIAMGDGGAANDPHNNGQNTNTLLGAILRIDINGNEDGKPYRIPADNPLRGKKNARPELWAWGLRNPWRFAFDRDRGALIAADVGQDEVEEIDIIRRGGNYGWRIMEGDICTPGVNPRCDQKGLLPPLHTYRHDTGVSITGGYVYRGRAIPGLCGAYLYSDYLTPKVWALRFRDNSVTRHATIYSHGDSKWFNAARIVTGGGLHVSAFGEDETGELYILNHQDGELLKIVNATR